MFLDEIGELPLATQAKLLRAIEQKEVLPVGANEPVAVEARIAGGDEQGPGQGGRGGPVPRGPVLSAQRRVASRLPPLRERREDIPDLVEFLLAKHARALGKRIRGVTHEAMQLLLACPWKGNVRELDNALQRAVILGDGPLLTPADLPPDLAPRQDDPALVDDLGEAVRRFEKQHIERVLRPPGQEGGGTRLGHRAQLAVPPHRGAGDPGVKENQYSHGRTRNNTERRPAARGFYSVLFRVIPWLYSLYASD